MRFAPKRSAHAIFQKVFKFTYVNSFQITKLNVKLLNEVDCVQHYPTSTVTDLLINSEQVASKSGNSNRIITEGQKTEPRDSTGDLVDPKSLYYGALYEVTCPHFLI